jgi:hypothetical protein
MIVVKGISEPYLYFRNLWQFPFESNVDFYDLGALDLCLVELDHEADA